MGTLYGEGTDKTALEGGLAETHANRMARLGAFLSQFKKQEEEKQQTVWEVMSDEELMDKFGTTNLDEFGVPKVGGYYNKDGQRISGHTGEAYDEPNKGLLRTWYNKLMPGDKFDFSHTYRQPLLFPLNESSMIHGKATNYPVTRTYDDGYGMN